MPPIVVQTQNLTKRFGAFTAVDRVSFELQQGEVMGYVGPNGSGKTTTIRMLLGLLLPTEGRATVMGFDSTRQAEEIRSRVGYMSQKFALYDELTAGENLRFYAGVYSRGNSDRLREVLEMVGLSGLEDVQAGKLPIGWRQRLALATAIVHRPSLLFLDEPTSGVDPVARRDFWDLIYHLADQGVTALVTTHYIDEAEYCGRVGIMLRGRLLAVDKTSELKKQALPGKAWDIRADPLLGGLEALERIPQVMRAGLSGDHLRAITSRVVKRRYLKSALKENGIRVFSIKQIEPSLEDVFLALASQ